jgi:ATP-dependent helicase Lhr and Lhr-like helicase
MTTMSHFSPITRGWFEQSFSAPTPAQIGGWEAIHRGDHTLIHAPTGSGKTLAAFLAAIDRLTTSPVPETERRCRVLYISPMKALAYDIEKNLDVPLSGIERYASHHCLAFTPITTAMRTGDTPQRERQAMLRKPPDILITTPESLYLMLTSRARSILASVDTVIVDEVHAIASSKRGSHLALSLERLESVTDIAPQRIGLSATQRPLQSIAEFLGGGTIDGSTWTPRPVTIVDAPADKTLDISVQVPILDLARPETTPLPADATKDLIPGQRRSVWPAVYPKLLDLIRDHTTTLLFVNSRGLAERLSAELNRLADEDITRAHHGSVSREQRVMIEQDLKSGTLRGVVATSTLELGIDIAAIDLVVLVGSPPSVASGLQRVGRAGHQVGAPSVARLFPKHRGDLLESAVVTHRMLAGAIEETSIPQQPLDVLAQQVVAMVASGPMTVDELFATIRRAGPYRGLPESLLHATLDMVSGRFPSDDFAEFRPRIIWDRATGELTPRGNAQLLAVTNAGTIPDRGLFPVMLVGGGKVGELDEEMVFESRPGDVFVLGASTWRIDEITVDRVIVQPAPGAPSARMPFWHGDAVGRPLELGRAVGEFVRTIGSMDADVAREVLRNDYALDDWACNNLINFFEDERRVTGVLPTDRSIVVERFRDEIGDWRIVVLSPFGARIHAPWALLARAKLREQLAADVDVLWSDDGFIFRCVDVDTPPPVDAIFLDPTTVSEDILNEVADSALFSSRFREAAARSLLLPRRRPGRRTPLWQQRRKAQSLLEVAKTFSTFPIILETYREILQDHFDIPALEQILQEVVDRTVSLSVVDVDSPSPFATSLMFDFVASFMYEYDAPLAEKQAAALTLDRSLLQELLGEPEFRELLDAEVIADLELELQWLTPQRTVTSSDGLHDLLRDLGPLTTQEIQFRCAVDVDAQTMIALLNRDRRAVSVHHNGTSKVAAVEDVARLRDALGVVPPAGLADIWLLPAEQPVRDVVGRYARTHGPFDGPAVAATLGLPIGVVEATLESLRADNKVVEGTFRPGGSGREWVDREVLRLIKRRSLARLRNEIEAVDQQTLATFLVDWHGIGTTSRQSDRLMTIVGQLQGRALPASMLETEILSRRMSYNPSHLDELLANGDVVWIGAGGLPGTDGRVQLFRRSDVPLLASNPPIEPIADTTQRSIIDHLAAHGASFFPDVYNAVGGGDPGTVVEALWELAWGGLITNDTFAPLRSRVRGKGRKPNMGGRPRRLSTSTPPDATGRWSLVERLITTSVPVTEEQRVTALVETLLDRHGVLTRDSVRSESIPGGFTRLYPVLAAMESSGLIRRGYFIEGLGGAQFARPTAVDRLRKCGSQSPLALGATDPAQPYGSTLPWPDIDAATLQRRPGHSVVLVNGGLVAYWNRNAKHIVTVGDASPGQVVSSLVTQAEAEDYRIETVNGMAPKESVLGRALSDAGFAPGYRGWTLRSDRRRP